MEVLIDGDPLVYQAGFKSQNNWRIIRWHEVVDPDDRESDIEHEHACNYVREREGMDNNVEQMVEELGLHPDEYEVYEWIDPLSEAYCLNIVKTMINNILDAIDGYLAESDKKVEKYTVFLSGSTNFRDNVATIPGRFDKETGQPVIGYKSNRKHSSRPFYYQRIRDYLIEHWNGTLIEGIEADDALAIRQWNEDEYDPQTVIATIDKDLLNVPGWHYNINKKVDRFVSFKQARTHFYRQLLTGDATDTIPGCYKVGQKKADKLIQEDMSELEMYAICVQTYVENIDKYPQRYTKEIVDLGPEDGAYVALIENARLLWMLQDADQAWTPPGMKDESLTDLGLMDFEDWDE